MLITLKNAKKVFGSDTIFEGLNFEIKEKDRIGLVGRNGCGKTTLFKLFTQVESLDEGNLFIKKNTKIGYLDQIPEFEGSVRKYLQSGFFRLQEMKQQMEKLEEQMQHPDTFEKAMARYGSLQDQFSRLGGYEMDAKLEAVANGLNIQHLLEHSFSSLSGGEKTKAGLGKILLEEPDVLFLDEPTNHLDLSAIEWLEDYLKEFQGACCIISHDRYFLDQAVNKIADLEAGELTIYHGNYSRFIKEKEERLLAEFKAYQEQQKKIKKMRETIKRLKEWANQANPPNEGLHRRARSMERALERMEKKEKPLIDPKKMKLSFQTGERSGTDVVKMKEVTKQFGDKKVLQGVDFHVRFRDRIAIAGKNGSGKSTLLNGIMGLIEPDSGEISVGSQVQIGYLSQHPFEHADPNQTVIDHFREHIRVTEGQARQILARFLFFGYAVFRKLHQLSGGERMRLKLAIFMHQNLNLLILDEPTNHLDLDSQEVLEEALDQFEGTVICVSHDRYFLNRNFKETAYLIDGKLYRFHGNYDETKEKWKEHLEKHKA
ncbi:MAG: ABC-F type ribosomal protection protein [Bacillaceae bacterium]|nr:ABC-F type ribosomal protection protein [Bacillaceae bacterium]